jgi:hypothetical protein
MKYLVFLLTICCLAACQTPPSTVTASAPAASRGVTFSGGNGSSFETAIVVNARDEISGVRSEYDYIRARYPGYRFISQALAPHGGKTYDIMTFKSADGKKHVLYFDISKYFGRGLGL